MEVRELNFTTDWAWVSEVISPVLCADTCGIVVTHREEIQGAAIYDSFTVSSANVHLGLSNRMVLRHNFLYFVADYIFNYRSRERIFGLTPENNLKARKFNRHIGMREVAHIPDAYDSGVGYIVTRMDKASSPWLKQPVRKEAA